MPHFAEPTDCRGWWQSRTGLEQKLIILSTLLFVLSFSLVISVIVIKNRSPNCEVTTIAPTTVTTEESISTVSGEVTSPSEETTEITQSSASGETVTPKETSTEAVSTKEATTTKETTPTTKETTPTTKETTPKTEETATKPISPEANSP